MVELGQIFTNDYIAKFMVSLFSIRRDARILEPCFGQGAFLRALKLYNYTNVVGCEIDTGLFSNTRLLFPNYDLINADFLSSNLEPVDGIIMNPPYIRHEKINALEPLGITKRTLQEDKLYQNVPQNANLYIYFIVKALSLLKPNGEMIVIFPSSWIKARGGEFLRTYFRNQGQIINQISISGSVFSENALVDVVILKIKKTFDKITTKEEKLVFDGTQLNSAETTFYRCELGLTFPFERLASAQRGLSTGCNRLFINPPQGVSSIPIITSPKSISGYSTINSKVDRLLFVGDNLALNKDTEDYLSKCEKMIISNHAPKSLYNKICSGEKWYRLNLIPSSGIIFSYFIRNDPKFILNETNIQVRDNFYIIRPHIDSFIAFALLNNLYTFYQLECIGKFYGAGLLKVQKYDIDKLMFVDIGLIAPEDIAELKRLAMKVTKTNDKSLVLEITRILSPYTLIQYEQIKEYYMNVKSQRLEDTHD